MKKIIFIFLISLLFIPYSVFATTEKSEYEFVTDNSNILDKDTRDYILDYSNDLHNRLGIDYYVVIIDNLEELDIEKYADTVYEKYGINQKGLLILLSLEDRRLRVKVGEELSDIIYSQLIDEYIDEYFMPYFKDGNFNDGIKNGYSSFYKLICNYYDVSSDEVVVYNDDNIIIKYKNAIIFLIIWFNTLIGYIFSEYFIRFFSNKKKSKLDFSIFIISLIISILLMILTYLINPKALIIVFIFEIIAVLSNIHNHDMKKVTKRKNKKIKKKEKG